MDVLITAGVVTLSIIIASTLFWLDGYSDSDDTVDRTYYDDKDDEGDD
jgi:hypothetical protein